jgi:hypothetical protein
MTFIGFAQRTRMRSALGNVPWMPHPSEKPVVDESLDSSSAMLPYEYVPERDWRDDVARVTCGSDVRSHEPASSSADESDANDADTAEGGNMRSRMLLCRHRGVGIETCGASQHAYCIPLE